jgi:hypothetical protein
MCKRVTYGLIVGMCALRGVHAQDDPPTSTINIRLKVFDTNAPSERLTPATVASNFVRDPVTRKAVFLENVPVERLKTDGAFDQLTVSKGWLVEKLVIQIVDARKVYNPAIVTKVVSNADMTIYPGASASTDEFSFNSYMAQMGAYQTLLAELLDEVGAGERERVRASLRAAFVRQLTNMSDVKARLKRPTSEEFRSARKIRDEVLRLYGIASVPEPSKVVSDCCRAKRRLCMFRRR